MAFKLQVERKKIRQVQQLPPPHILISSTRLSALLEKCQFFWVGFSFQARLVGTSNDFLNPTIEYSDISDIYTVHTLKWQCHEIF